MLRGRSDCAGERLWRDGWGGRAGGREARGGGGSLAGTGSCAEPAAGGAGDFRPLGFLLKCEHRVCRSGLAADRLVPRRRPRAIQARDPARPPAQLCARGAMFEDSPAHASQDAGRRAQRARRTAASRR